MPPLQSASTDPVSGLLGHVRWLADYIPFLRLGSGLDTLEVTVRSFQSLWFQLANWSSLAADALVPPDLRNFWFLQFGEASSIIAVGEEAAEAAVPHIRRTLSERVGLETVSPRATA